MNKKRSGYSYGHGLNIRSYLARLFICTSTLAFVGTGEDRVSAAVDLRRLTAAKTRSHGS